MSDTGSPLPRPSRRDRPADQQYWQLWRQGQRPDLASFLAARPGLSADEVAAVISVDQYERWSSGERVPAERYLPLLPAGPGLEQAGCDIVYGEYLLREQLGEAPALAEFQRRFPDQADLLARQVQLHHALAEHPEDLLAPPATILAQQVVPPPAPPSPASFPVIPGYQLLGEIGRGGMGMVYRARQESLGRIVALKVLHVRPGDDTATRRMRREAEALARLSHPHIVAVYDAGMVGEWFYFAMEYVPGIDLHRLVERNGPLPPEQAREYLRQAALGLQHAFEHGLVHRDIKPSNLIVTQQPGAGVLKVLDLGLARAPEERPDAAVTQVGTFLGTPDFIAPEQAHDARTADIRSDLYSLGCTFYYALAGRAPFDAAATPLAKLMQHQLSEPPPLSPALPNGLSAIIRKLMAKNPADRFQTPAELLHALEDDRAEGGPKTEVIGASSSASLRPLSFTLRLVRKLLGPGDWVKCVAFSPEGRLLAAGSLDRTVRLWEGTGARDMGRIDGHTAGVLCLAFSAAGTDLAVGCQDRVLCLWDLGDGPDRPRLRWRSLGHRGNVNAVAFLPGGERLLSASHDGTLRLWESATGRELRAWPAHAGAVWSVAVAPDGRTALSGGNDRLVRLWDLERGEALASWPEQDLTVSCVAFSPDGRLALSGGGVARLWDVAGGREVRTLEGHQGRVLAGAFSPDGRWVLTGSRDQGVRLFDVAGGRCLASAAEHTWWVTGVAWAPAGNLAASASGDRSVCLWRIEA